MKKVASLFIVLIIFISIISVNALAQNYYAGDVNRDGNVNLKDSLILKYYLAGWNVAELGFTFDEKLADVDNNGTINMKDKLALRNHVCMIG